MRISADYRDPDYIGQGNHGRYVVHLDGRPIDDVVEADNVACSVTVFMRDDSGKFDRDPVTRMPRRHTVKGFVRIIDTRPESKP